MCPESEQKETYQSYPLKIVLLANLLTASVYAFGALILFQLSVKLLLVYLAFCAFLEVKVLASSCVHCWYYGKVCFSGKGLISALFFKPGDPEKFSTRTITWFSLLPDLLVSLVPAIAAIYLMAVDFQWNTPLLLTGLLAAAFPGTGYVRKTQACCHCEQKQRGCPAEKLFQKK
jgi:hypothetical protein